MPAAIARRTGGLQQSGRIWRYNYAILLGGGYWVIVLPVAATMVVTLWMMALATDFNQPYATRLGELMIPILGAFLASHCLAPELRSGTGAVLASKPFPFYRVIGVRFLLALLTPVLLVYLSLMFCSMTLSPIDIGPVILAAVPPLWFLSALALLCSILFRSPLAGLMVPAALWVVDVVLGYSANPFLSGRGLSAMLEREVMSNLWIYGKGLLLLLGTLLLSLQTRNVHRLCRSADQADLFRIAAWVAAAAAGYAFTGLVCTLAYAHVHRARLPFGDVAWLRRQMAAYGPLPVTRLFGPAFHTYVQQPLNRDGSVNRTLRASLLERAVEAYPRSIWADSIAYALALEVEAVEPPRCAEAFLRVADLHGSSPFAPRALSRVIRLDPELVGPAERLLAARRLLADYAGEPEAERAAEYVMEPSLDIGPPERLNAARVASRVASMVRRPLWRVEEARQLIVLGDREGARQAAAAAREASLELQRRALQPNAPTELASGRVQIDATLVAADELLRRLGAPPGE